MKITHPLFTKSFGLFGATVIRALTATLDYRIVYDDPLVDPVHPRRPRHAIYLLWHEYLIFPLGMRGKKMTVLISQHRDGELITQVMRHLGFRAVRGSSTRGGVRALRRILKTGRHGDTPAGHGDTEEENRGSRIEDGASAILDPRSSMLDPRSSIPPCLRVSVPVSPHLAGSLILTPDGPRGPRRRLAEGSIFLASRLQMPIVCMGFAFQRPWRQKSWDRFAVPRPFSRARAVISPFIEIPANLQLRGSRMEDRGSKEGQIDRPPSSILHPRSSMLDPHSSILHARSSDLEYWRLKVEQILNQVTGEAESWAESGRRKPGEMPILRHQPAPQMTRPAA